jgi:ABC-type Zn uptake system ZnuABC Zn-binding protein ZnuA
MKNKILLAFIAWFSLVGWSYGADLKVCATVPELGDLARVIGGDHVDVKVFVKGQEDPHALVAKPSNVYDLSRADLFIVLGMEMEMGWAPALIERSRNNKVLIGNRGYLDTSRVITPIFNAPTNIITRAMGDLHPDGNPHYMVDPVNGLKVARLICSTFSDLKPSLRGDFQENLAAFEKQWGIKAFGKILSERYGIDPLVSLVDKGKLQLFLSKTKETGALSGWFGELAPLKGTHFISDHQQWIYFAKRFGLKVERALEPKPGVPAGSKYLKDIVEWIKANEVKGVFASPYFNPRHLAFVQQNGGVKVMPMAHQVGSRNGTASYLAMIDHNVGQVRLCGKVY